MQKARRTSASKAKGAPIAGPMIALRFLDPGMLCEAGEAGEAGALGGAGIEAFVISELVPFTMTGPLEDWLLLLGKDEEEGKVKSDVKERDVTTAIVTGSSGSVLFIMTLRLSKEKREVDVLQHDEPGGVCISGRSLSQQKLPAVHSSTASSPIAVSPAPLQLKHQ